MNYKLSLGLAVLPFAPSVAGIDSDTKQHSFVVCTTDQAFYLGEHGWFDKRFMCEESSM